MQKLQTQLNVKQPSFLNELMASDISKKAKRFKITMAASMAV